MFLRAACFSVGAGPASCNQTPRITKHARHNHKFNKPTPRAANSRLHRDAREMRSSRISHDTSKLFDRASAATSPPRRATRSLSRFAYNAETSRTITTDIEDAVSSSTPAKRRNRRSFESPAKLVKTVMKDPHTVISELSSPPARKQRKPAKTTVDPTTGSVTARPPSDWQAMYDSAKKMRSAGGQASNAAVDTMGCERLADTTASPKEQRFHTLVALMLSSQTKDTVNAVAMARLKTELPPYEEGAPAGLNLDNVLAVDAKLLNEMIWAVGFHNNKTKYIKATAEILRDKHAGDIPDTIEGLTSLPGVGPKMAYLCLSAAWDRTEGIGVDVHVHRITNLWGWHKTKSPEDTRHALQAWLPRDKWREINWLLVGFGQTVCLPAGRRCGDCDLGLSGLCKAADRKKVNEGRKMQGIKADVKEELGIKEEL